MFRKWDTSFCVYNILIATHLQPEYTTNTHEMRGEHSVRRRGPIHRARILTLPNIHIHFNKYAFSHYQIRIFIPPHTYVPFPFCGCLHICKHHKIVHQRTLATCYNTTTYTKHLLSHCKNHTFARQKPPFCTPKTILLQRKNPLFD